MDSVTKTCKQYKEGLITRKKLKNRFMLWLTDKEMIENIKQLCAMSIEMENLVRSITGEWFLLAMNRMPEFVKENDRDISIIIDKCVECNYVDQLEYICQNRLFDESDLKFVEKCITLNRIQMAKMLYKYFDFSEWAIYYMTDEMFAAVHHSEQRLNNVAKELSGSAVEATLDKLVKRGVNPRLILKYMVSSPNPREDFVIKHSEHVTKKIVELYAENDEFVFFFEYDRTRCTKFIGKIAVINGNWKLALLCPISSNLFGRISRDYRLVALAVKYDIPVEYDMLRAACKIGYASLVEDLIRNGHDVNNLDPNEIDSYSEQVQIIIACESECPAKRAKMFVEYTKVEKHDGASCSICMDEDPCRRCSVCKCEFHEKCIRRWLSETNSCPHCREDIASHSENS